VSETGPDSNDATILIFGIRYDIAKISQYRYDIDIL